MAEWHVTPDYIVNNWTEELLELMVKKLVERKHRETGALSGDDSLKVDAETLSKVSNGMIEVKHGD